MQRADREVFKFASFKKMLSAHRLLKSWSQDLWVTEALQSSHCSLG